MTTLNEIKAQKEVKVSELIKTCLMFFAFSNEQFTANKTPLQDGEKYVHLFAGAYMPKGQVDNYLNGMELINKWYKKEINTSKKMREDNILYELNNHEAYYTGDIEDTLSSLGKDYTRKEVWKVYQKNQAEQMEKY